MRISFTTYQLRRSLWRFCFDISNEAIKPQDGFSCLNKISTGISYSQSNVNWGRFTSVEVQIIIPCGIYHPIIDWIADQESRSSAAELWGRGMFQDKLTVNLPKRRTWLVYVSVGLCRVYPRTSPNLRLKSAASNKSRAVWWSGRQFWCQQTILVSEIWKFPLWS